jgi:dolichol-phosphate mannosyltransferase
MLRMGGFLGLILLACAIFAFRLDLPLLEPQEARYAEIPRQMLLHNRFLVPILHEQDYLDKPPLLYWSVMLSYHCFGTSDFSARLIPAFSCILLVLAVSYWGHRAYGAATGWGAGVMLCLLPDFVYRGRMLTFDIVLALWITLSLMCAHFSTMSRHRWGWLAFSSLACGLALLTKGPVALVLLSVPMVVLVRRAIPLMLWGVGAVVVAGPWFLVVAQGTSGEGPSLWSYFFWKHNIVRFFAPFDHAKPVWFYVPQLVLGLFPAVLLGAALRKVAARFWLPLLSFAWIVFFFTLSGCKRPTYLLPAYPALAVVLGGWLCEMRDLWRESSYSAGWGCFVGLALLWASVATAWMPAMADVQVLLLNAGLGTAIIGVLLWRVGVNWQVAVVALGWATISGVGLILPAYHEGFSLRTQLLASASIEQNLQAHEPKVVACYPQRYDSVEFYLRQSRVQVFGPEQRKEFDQFWRERPGTLLVIKNGEVLRSWLAELPTDVRFRPMKSLRGAVIVGIVEPVSCEGG